MSSQKPHRELARFLEEHGYVLDHTNAKGFETWMREGRPDVKASQAIKEGEARRIRSRLEKAFGEVTAGDRSKRSPTAVRKRQTRERAEYAAAVERHEVAIADMERQLEARPDGLGKVLTPGEVLSIEAHVERRERELRRIRALMCEIPAPHADSSSPRARHRA